MTTTTLTVKFLGNVPPIPTSANCLARFIPERPAR